MFILPKQRRETAGRPSRLEGDRDRRQGTWSSPSLGNRSSSGSREEQGENGGVIRTKWLFTEGELRTWALVFATGEEVIEPLMRFAQEQELTASEMSAIGALREATLGYFDLERKDYDRISVREQVELLSLIGHVTREPNEKPNIHAHVVLGKADGTAVGGHLSEAVVRPTLELILTESPAHLRRRSDRATGPRATGPRAH